MRSDEFNARFVQWQGVRPPPRRSLRRTPYFGLMCSVFTSTPRRKTTQKGFRHCPDSYRGGIAFTYSHQRRDPNGRVKSEKKLRKKDKK
jgi:hypothetical protein